MDRLGGAGHDAKRAGCARHLDPSARHRASRLALSKNLVVIAGLASLAVFASVGLAWWLASSGGAVHYATAPVTRGAVTRTVTATGTVNPVLTIIVGTYVSGVIQEPRVRLQHAS